ncbi:hypothetical protein L1987_72140 [Smallanthus sonchifolius]|uniref:Uncharacterized protein n=1 Tax=Smallanthus sonchifolius TaxID=185202 RepID=A0ACB9AVR3_9ASTR|nr:hypothetical protein L1987_72140 [Smallanthus sonchifolius]
MILNFRKEILAFISKPERVEDEETIDDCSDILVVSDTMAVAVHNEDANVALVGHTYLIKAKLSNGLSYTAYTYAGELPSCAFGFNNHGLILNVETASSQRLSVQEVGSTPFFHANMYLHLEVDQVHDQNSISRQNRAALLPKRSKQDLLSLLGDTGDHKYPIFMQGPNLYTLCTAVIDLDERTLAITEANPRKGEVSYVFTMA